MKFFSFLLATVLLFPALSRAEDPSAILGRVQKRYTSLSTLQAQFVQISTRRNLMGNLEEIKQEGKVSIKKPGKLRWDYLQPEKKVYVTNGEIFWIYDAPQKSATRGQWDPNSLALQFLIGRGDLQKDFSVKVPTAEDIEKNHVTKSWLALTPKNPDSMAGVSTLFVEIDDKQFLITQAVILDALESRTHWQFSKLTTNIALPDALFNFSPPKGTKVK